jgi:predicted transcriptional regulator
MIDKTMNQIASDLEAIKKLMILNMMENGYSQAKIAAAIGTSQASISRMFATKKAKAGDGE